MVAANYWQTHSEVRWYGLRVRDHAVLNGRLIGDTRAGLYWLYFYTMYLKFKNTD